MKDDFCPGAKQRNLAKPETIPCPECHEDQEIWSDEKETTCENCGKTISRA